jgi:hypothetical protein
LEWRQERNSWMYCGESNESEALAPLAGFKPEPPDYPAAITGVCPSETILEIALISLRHCDRIRFPIV